MSIESIEALHNEAVDKIEAKNRVVDENIKIAEDGAALQYLFDHLEGSDALERLNEAGQSLLDHKEDTASVMEKADSEMLGVREKVIRARQSMMTTINETNKLRFRSVDNSPAKKLIAEQKENIAETDRILDLMDKRNADFHSMLRLAGHYYNAAERLSRARFSGNNVEDFTGHTQEHCLEVQGKMAALQETMKTVGRDGGNSFDFFGDKTMDAAAAFHDTGMSGGLSYVDTLFLGAFHTDLVRRQMRDNPTTRNEKADWNSEGLSPMEVREKHAFESAMNIFSHREELSKLGADVDKAAFLISLHSKKGFLEHGRPRDLSKKDFEDIKDAARNFANACRNRDIHWDMSWLCKDGVWNEKALEQVKNSASIMRFADANRDGTRLYAQNGAKYIFDDKNLARGSVDYRSRDDLKSRMSQEVEKVHIAYDNGQTCREVANEFSCAIVFGEHNVNSINLDSTERGTLVYRFVVDSPDKAVGCTAYTILERLDELNGSAFADWGGTVEIVSDNGSTHEILKCLKQVTSEKGNFGLPKKWDLKTT
jgi:hypothetical protein